MTKQFARPLIATLLAGVLALAPIMPAFAQNPSQEPHPAPAPQAPAPQPSTTMPQISLGMAKYNYTKVPSGFPNLIAPYRQISIPPDTMTNSPQIEQMIHEGKLELSLQDAIELALENNIDIVVSRYNPWLADTSILKTKSGSFGPGVQGGAFGSSTANIPALLFDPCYRFRFSGLPHHARQQPLPLRNRHGCSNRSCFTHGDLQHPGESRLFHGYQRLCRLGQPARFLHFAVQHLQSFCPVVPHGGHLSAAFEGLRPLRQSPQYHDRQEQSQDCRPGLRAAGHHHHHQCHHRLLGTRFRP